jgi:uncharacterized protein YkwD
MKKVTGIFVFIILMAVVVVGAFSCGQKTGGAVTQEEYNALQAQLSAAEAKIGQLQLQATATVTPTGNAGEQALKDEIASLKAQVDELGTKIDVLTKQNDTLTADKDSLTTSYAELNMKYQELQKSFAALTQPKTITEEDVENQIFALINQERVKAGIPVLSWGKQLYNSAKLNSRNMAAAGKTEYAPDVLYQEILIAAGYDSVSEIARGALLTWKLDQYTFEHGALLPGNTYGAVGAYQTGGIVYITFLAAFFP